MGLGGFTSDEGAFRWDLSVSHLSVSNESLLVLQIVLRDLEPKEDNRDIDAVVTMRRYVPHHTGLFPLLHHMYCVPNSHHR